MKRSVFFLLFAVGFSVSALAEVRTGRIFSLDQPDKEIFVERTTYTRYSVTDYTTKATIEDMTGNIVMRETSKVEKSVVIEQFMEQLQLNEAYELKREGDKLIFSTYKLDGEKRSLLSSSKETVPTDFVTGPGIGIFLQNHRAQLEKGEAVKSQFGIFEMEKSIGFSFQKKATERGIIGIQMKISSFLLRMLVDPIDIEVDAESFKIVGFRGRTPLRTGPSGKMVPLDAKILYSYSDQEGK